MQYLLILPLCLLAVSKVTIQSRFSKDYIRKPVDAILFNTLIFAACALPSLPSLLQGIAPSTWIWGGAFGLFSVLFQLFYCFALRYGSVSITVLIVNCSMIIPVCVSAFLFREPLTTYHIIGIVLILITFLLNTEKSSSRFFSMKWFVFLLGAFFANSGGTVIQKLFTKYTASTDNSAFVAAAYLFAAVVSIGIALILRSRKQYCSFSFTPRVWITALSIGVILFLFQILNTYTMTQIDGTILFPVYNGGTALLATCSGCILFHEKLSPRQMLGLASGICGIVCMCL